MAQQGKTFDPDAPIEQVYEELQEFPFDNLAEKAEEVFRKLGSFDFAKYQCQQENKKCPHLGPYEFSNGNIYEG